MPSLDCPNGAISQIRQALFLGAMEMEDAAFSRRESIRARAAFAPMIAAKELAGFYERLMTDLRAAQALADYDVLMFRRYSQQASTGFADADEAAKALAAMQQALVKTPGFLSGLQDQAAGLYEKYGRTPPPEPPLDSGPPVT